MITKMITDALIKAAKARQVMRKRVIWWPIIFLCVHC